MLSFEIKSESGYSKHNLVTTERLKSDPGLRARGTPLECERVLGSYLDQTSGPRQASCILTHLG